MTIDFDKRFIHKSKNSFTFDLTSKEDFIDSD